MGSLYLRMSYISKCRHHLHTHWGHVMYICVSKLTIIGSDNGLLPDCHQAIIWTNAGILLIRTTGTNSEILSEIHTASLKKMRWKMLSVKWQQFVSASKCLYNFLPLSNAYFFLLLEKAFKLNWLPILPAILCIIIIVAVCWRQIHNALHQLQVIICYHHNGWENKYCLSMW